MKGLQFVTVLIILNLLLLPFCIGAGNAAGHQMISSDDYQSEFMSANDALFDYNIFVVSSSRDSSEDERESLEHGQIIPFLALSVIPTIHLSYPQNTSTPAAVTISRDTPPPRLLA